ncbi:small integral membrane protein 13 isoform X2 [Cuculus canorus]|uniref:small integral membrane protein 13 isoform X2 n=1 Tax=Cuculus canorus TaxID=55661 RepID=UPI0023AB4E45|nr:small integral membrane protein 13 isoform X2 [Cuculus canorus]
MDLWRSSRPTPLLKEVHLDQVTQDCVQITFKFLSPTSTRVVFPQDSSISKHRGTLSQNRSSSHQEDHLGRSREQQVREITTYTNRTVLCINEIMLLYKGQQGISVSLPFTSTVYRDLLELLILIITAFITITTFCQETLLMLLEGGRLPLDM